MLRICLLVLSILYFLPIVDAQEREGSLPNPIVFEAHYVGEGMSWIQGKFLILRVYSNGNLEYLEYEDIAVENYQKKVFLRNHKLSEIQLSVFLEFLVSQEFRSLPDKYSSFSSTIDHKEDLIFKVLQTDAARLIVAENFKPELAQAKTIYPATLIGLACWAEHARKDANVKFFFRESECSPSFK